MHWKTVHGYIGTVYFLKNFWFLGAGKGNRKKERKERNWKKKVRRGIKEK